MIKLAKGAPMSQEKIIFSMVLHHASPWY